MVSRRAFHLALVIATRSAAAGAPGVSVTVAVRVTPNHVAVMVAVVVALTEDVLTAKAALDFPASTTVSAGTWTTPGLLLESWTTAPLVAPVKVTVPVVGLPPVTLDGLTETDDSDGPAGVAALTERLAVRGTFWTAAMIWTMVGGAAALVVIVNVTLVAPGGTTVEGGTVAAEGSLLKSSTVVGDGSGNARVTVPCDDAPPRTESGESDSDEMMPAAEAPAGTTSSAAVADTAARTARRRMGLLARGVPASLQRVRGAVNEPLVVRPGASRRRPSNVASLLRAAVTVARVRVEESVEIARSPQEVWALVADPLNDPRWCRKV